MTMQAERKPAASAAAWGPLDILKAIGFVVAGSILGFIPVGIVLLVIAGDHPEDHPTALTIEVGSSAVLQIMMFLAVWRFAVRKYRQPWSALGLRAPVRGSWWLPIPLVIGAYSIMIAYFGALSAFGINPDTDLPDQVYDNIGPIVALVALSLCFAPVMEETFFRGFVFGGLRGRWGVPLSALASGLLFGIVHTLNPGAFYIVPPIAAVGALFAFGYAYSDSIFPTMAAHFLFNLISVTLGIASS